MTEPVIKIEVDDEDVKRIADGIDKEISDKGVGETADKGAGGSGLKEVKKESKAVSEQLGGFSSVLGNILKIAGPAVILGGAFSKMAQFSGPFIGALQELEIFMIELGQIMGEALAPVLRAFVNIFRSAMPLLNFFFNILGVFTKALESASKNMDIVFKAFQEVIALIARGFDRIIERVLNIFGIEFNAGIEKAVRGILAGGVRGNGLKLVAGGAPAGFAGSTPDFVLPQAEINKQSKKAIPGLEVAKAERREEKETERQREIVKESAEANDRMIQAFEAGIVSSEQLENASQRLLKASEILSKKKKTVNKFGVQIITKGD
jgi:hypothetical protein